MTLLTLTAGLVILLGGGAALVRGASGLAATLGVSPMIVGLTVVAFGTSAPELTVNLLAATSGRAGIAFGNVVGSNLANLGFVLGLTALVRPIVIHGSLIAREIPLLVLGSVAALVLALDPTLRGAPAAYDRTDGLMLLLFFAIFLYVTARDVLRGRRDPLLVEAEEAETARSHPGLAAAGTLIAVGLVGLLVGGELTVDATVDIARAVGVPETVVALVLLALGTSLPELVTSIMAVRHGETDMAVANLVGSNIFNLLFVLPITVVAQPFSLPPGAALDLVAGLVLAIVLMPVSFTHQRRIVRWEGAMLVALWAGYAAWRVAGG